MNNNEHDNKLEQRIRFVAKRYREGSLDPDKACKLPKLAY